MFAVIWTKRALGLLAEFYVEATPEDRVRMAAGVESPNQKMATDPLEVGESRSKGFRVAFLPLVIVGFQVDMSARTVRVQSIKRFGS
jgi:hypothetical protein